MDKYLPQPKGTTTLRSYLRCDTVDQFRPAEVDPSLMSQQDMNCLVGWTVTQAPEFTFGHHYYSVGAVVHRQLDGGPQDLDTSVEMSDVT